MGLKTLAEAIILQAADDFMNKYRCDEDIEFFGSDGFRTCSRIAGMSHEDQCEFLNLMRRRVSLRKPARERYAPAAGQRIALHA